MNQVPIFLMSNYVPSFLVFEVYFVGKLYSFSPSDRLWSHKRNNPSNQPLQSPKHPRWQVLDAVCKYVPCQTFNFNITNLKQYQPDCHTYKTIEQQVDGTDIFQDNFALIGIDEVEADCSGHKTRPQGTVQPDKQFTRVKKSNPNTDICLKEWSWDHSCTRVIQKEEIRWSHTSGHSCPSNTGCVGWKRERCALKNCSCW